MTNSRSLHPLIEQEIPRLRRYARLFARDRDTADDLVQESLLRALSGLHTFVPGTNMRAWLFTILHNVFRNDYRRAKRNPVQPNSDLIADHAATAVRGNQESHMELTRVQAALSTLSEDFREVILLCGVEGLLYEEAAGVLGIPVGTVRSRLSRARSALREAVTTKSCLDRRTPLLPSGLKRASSRRSLPKGLPRGPAVLGLATSLRTTQ
jgi:RNA polymerase sigma-70 factor, ECF subfamily